MTTMNKPRVRRISDSEVVIEAPRSTAFEHVAEALEKLGTLKQRDPNETFIDGRIRFGLQSVAMRVSLVERDPGQTTVVIQGSSDDAWGMGAKTASKRLVQMLENLDNPGFKADRLGIHPLALVGVVIAFGFILWLIMEKLGVR
jgi:hypothetical protein